MKMLKHAALLGVTSLSATPAFAAAAKDPWYADTTNWAFATLIIFMLIVWRLGAFKALGGALDSRAKEIERELAQAQSLREEAAEKLKAAERRQMEATDLAESILRQAEAEAKSLTAQAEKDLAELVARREAQVESRIARAEAEAKLAVKRVAADAATAAAAQLIRASADTSKGSESFQKALSQVKTAL